MLSLQKIVEFKDFSMPLSDFPVLFKDYSRKPSKFKYFSSLCEPCTMKLKFSNFHLLLKMQIGKVKPVLNCHSKRRPKLGFKTNYPLMPVESIAECSKGSILFVI